MQEISNIEKFYLFVISNRYLFIYSPLQNYTLLCISENRFVNLMSNFIWHDLNL